MSRRFTTATLLNFVGLVVAFVSCYLFLTQVAYNHSYNRGLKDSDELYRVEVPAMMDVSKWQANVTRYLADLLAELPQVEGMALMQGWYNNWTFSKGMTEVTFEGNHANDEALATLAPRLLDGTLTWTPETRRQLIIPASIAMQYFGSTQVAGRCMRLGQDSIQVMGVYEDFPDNCLIHNCIYAPLGDEGVGNYQNYNYMCYLRLNGEIDTDEIEQAIVGPLLERFHQTYIDHGMRGRWDPEKIRGTVKVRLRPLSETWFSGVSSEDDKGNRTVDWILQLACVLVLLVAAINFINFMLAESPMRLKSINTRMVLGSTRRSLRLSIVGEAVLTSLLAYAVAIVICLLLSNWPLIGSMTIGSISIGDHPWLLAVTGMAAVVVGMAAGAYPAYYVTSFQPSMVLKGAYSLSPRGRRLRTLLLTLQFVITCVMVVYISILYLQSRYIFSSDYGFAKDEILHVDTWELLDKQEALRMELLQQPGIVDVAYSQFALGSRDAYMQWGRDDEKHYVQFTAMPVDWHYLRTMGIEVVEGRDFNEHDGDCYIINEAARRQWDWVEMDQKLLDNEGELPVVGVCRNVRFGSTRMDNNELPLVFVIYGETYLSNGWTNNLGVMNVRVAPGCDKQQVRQQVKELCMKMGATHEPDARYVDQMLEETYQEEFRFIRQVMVFSFICLTITLIGVFCMTLFETEYRRKEIGIRKVMGSTAGEILGLLCRRYVWLLLVSFAVAAPLACHIGRQWLSNFAERTPIYWWIFPLAMLCVALVTMTTIVVQSWRTANENPVNSITSE